eukprot:369977-Hanusia_phi.AAC.1
MTGTQNRLEHESDDPWSTMARDGISASRLAGDLRTHRASMKGVRGRFRQGVPRGEASEAQ